MKLSFNTLSSICKMNRLEVYVLFAICVAAIIAAPNVTSKKHTSNNVCTSEGCIQAAQKILRYIDKSVNPCDDFYKFACGGFLNSTNIPSDKPGITPYILINDILNDRLKTIFDERPQKTDIKPFLAVKRFYGACMDSTAIAKNGLTYISSIIKELGGWPVVEGQKWKDDSFDWINMAVRIRKTGLFHNTFLSFGVDNQLKNSSLGILTVDQPGLGLPQEVLTQFASNPVAQAYYKLMTNISIIFGADPKFAEQEMLDALNFEIGIANISVPAEKLRDANLLYNPSTLGEMETKYKEIPWVDFATKFFDGQQIDASEKVNVQQPQYVTEIIKLLKRTPKRVQANYVIWRAVRSAVVFLNDQLMQEILDFEKYRTGITVRNERWQECVAIIKEKLPELSGAMYVRKYFSPEAREKVEEIVHSLKKVFGEIIQDNDWMADATKRHALRKLSNMHQYVGYSDELLDDKVLEDYFSGLELNSDNFLQLELNISLFATKKATERLREIVPRSDWRTRSSPAIINAYYNPTDNTIEFPAGILQDVYFDKKRPRYINFGAIGFLIGHEITHGFDDQGRQFDESGNLVDWWDKKTSESFVKKAQCIVDQYSNYTVEEVGLSLNGVTSQGENIADNGGVKESYLAYQNWLKHHSPEKGLPGLNYTPNQLFWISTSNIWCSVYNPQYLRLLIQTNAHCPDNFRVIGALQNSEYFAKDFDCPIGSPMNPVNKCSVW